MDRRTIQAVRRSIDELKAHGIKPRLVGGEPSAVNVPERIGVMAIRNNTAIGKRGEGVAFADVEVIGANGAGRNAENFGCFRGIFILLPKADLPTLRPDDGNQPSFDVGNLPAHNSAPAHRRRAWQATRRR